MNEVNKKIGNYRYRIHALVFMATTINYFDRSIVKITKIVFKKKLIQTIPVNRLSILYTLPTV